MKDVVMQFVVNLPSMICIGISGYLLYNGIEGWGWFLFVGLLTIWYIGENEN